MLYENEFVEAGGGWKTPARIIIHLRPDGSIEMENSGAGSLWCQKHDKGLRVMLIDGEDPLNMVAMQTVWGNITEEDLL